LRVAIVRSSVTADTVGPGGVHASLSLGRTEGIAAREFAGIGRTTREGTRTRARTLLAIRVARTIVVSSARDSLARQTHACQVHFVALRILAAQVRAWSIDDGTCADSRTCQVLRAIAVFHGGALVLSYTGDGRARTIETRKPAHP
jgi:hypothetical protein